MRERLKQLGATELYSPLAVCLYILAYALPVTANFGLMVLAVLGALAAWSGGISAGAGPRRLWMPVATFVLVTLLTATVSVDVPRSFALSAALLPSVAICLLIAGGFTRRESVDWLLAAHLLVGGGISVAVAVALSRMGWRVPAGYENWIARVNCPLLVVSNDLAYLALLAPFAVALWMGGGWWRRVLAGSFLVSALLIAGVAQRRQVALLLLVMLAGMSLLLRPRWALVSAGAATALMLFIDVALGWPLTGRFELLWRAGEAGQTGLWDARLPIWSHAWQMFLAHPLFGQGPHTFSYTSVDGIQVSWAHNLYLETLAEQGVVGLASLVTLLGALLWQATKNWTRARTDDAPLAAALLTATVGILLGGLVEFTFLREWLTVLLFTVAGLLARQEILSGDLPGKK